MLCRLQAGERQADVLSRQVSKSSTESQDLARERELLLDKLRAAEQVCAYLYTHMCLAFVVVPVSVVTQDHFANCHTQACRHCSRHCVQNLLIHVATSSPLQQLMLTSAAAVKIKIESSRLNVCTKQT